MKIFFVARGWPSKRDPQWGNFESDQALALRKMGLDVVVLSVDTRIRWYYRKLGVTKEVHSGIPHYNLYAGAIWVEIIRRISVKLHISIKGFLIRKLFKKVVKAEGLPDVIYAHYLRMCSMALALKRKYSIPVVGIEHWSELGYSDIKDSVRYEASRTYPNMDCLLVVSSALKENVKKNIGVDTIVLNNMVGKEFSYAPKEIKDHIVHFVTVGNLLPVKGFDNLINAFDLLHLPSETWSLKIIGGGKEHQHLQELINNLRLNKNIQLCGRKNRTEIIELLQNSDIYVMSSRSETFGVAAIEALACGLPIVATDCGGARDFLTKENGLMCPVNDVKKLSEAISQMYKNYKEYDKAMIASECQRRFSSEAIGKQLEKIFEDVISKSKQQ